MAKEKIFLGKTEIPYAKGKLYYCLSKDEKGNETGKICIYEANRTPGRPRKINPE